MIAVYEYNPILLNMSNKKINFFERCEEIKKTNKRSVSTIYGQFAQVRFAELSRGYEAQVSKQKEAIEQLVKERAEMITVGCFNCYEEIQKCLCHRTGKMKPKFDRLNEFAQDLALQKSLIKVALVNTLGQVKKMLAFHKQLLQG